MTTISVPGKITALEVDESGDFDISSLSGGTSGSPATISPSGKANTVILASISAGHSFLQLGGAFNVGDVVEVYSFGGSFVVTDENGQTVANGVLNARMRKVLTGTPGTPTWGAVSSL
jgi:2',3'-cyclic-nucleotide 2'-phosphodiesterase (5'-nucleotidase family)